MIYQGIPEKKKYKDAWEVIKTLCQGAENLKVQMLKTIFGSLSMKDIKQIDPFWSRPY